MKDAFIHIERIYSKHLDKVCEITSCDGDIFHDENDALRALVNDIDDEYCFFNDDYAYTICIRDGVATQEDWYDRACDLANEINEDIASENAHRGYYSNPANRN